MVWNLPRAANGAYKHQVEPLEGSRCNSISPNWCDKTTWYSSSERQTDEVMNDSGDHTVYELTTPCYVVDVTHGKITHETRMVSTYGVIVKVDDITKTENSPNISDADFSVDYTTGTVTFNEALVGTEVVKVTYNKVIDSVWRVVPLAGKKLRLTAVELQFSDDGILADSVVFQVKAAVGMLPAFDPYLLRSGGISSFTEAGVNVVTVTTSDDHGLTNGYVVTIAGTQNYNNQYVVSGITDDSFQITHSWEGDEPSGQWSSGAYPEGTLIGAAEPVIYKSMKDIVNECNGSFPVIPALGGDGWRGLQQPINIFRWDYVATTDLRSDWGMELHISLENDIQCSGWWAAATLYHISEDL